MNTTHHRFHLSITALALLLSTLNLQLSTVLAQGPLTPPGAPAPTMKTLQQIEPRIDLQNAPAPAVDTTNASFHFVITQPGSYYLSANVGVTKTNGIRINSRGITLDLNGFQVSRASGTGGDGIQIIGADGASVRNGAIRGFDRGVAAQVITNLAEACGFRDLSVSECTSIGISAGTAAVVESCRIHNNTGATTAALIAYNGSTLINCTASSNAGTGISAGSGSTLTNCAATFNQGNGIQVGPGTSLNNCAASGNTGTYGILAAEGCTVTNSTAASNTGDGFSLGTGSTILNCTARLNGGDGVETGNHASVTGITVSENGGQGINASSSTTIRSCTVRANDGNGILVVDAGLVTDCVVNLNGKKPSSPVNLASDGIEMGARNRVVNCTLFDNAQHGIHSTSSNNRNFIEGCLAQANDSFAITLQGNGNTVIKNQVGGNAGAINQSGGNIAPTQSASDAVGTIHPLANFQ
jgi:parallel beta-helix repeat protein